MIKTQMCYFRALLILAALSALPVSGFVSQAKSTKPVKLQYITGREPASVNDLSLALPISQIAPKGRNIYEAIFCINPFTSKKRLSKVSGKTRYINNRHSSSDWLHNLKTLPSSTVLREIRSPLLTLTGWACAVSIFHQLFLMYGKAHLAAKMAVPLVAHSLLMSSLGLLLVFRTNSSYQRFLEGRKIWGDILSTARNLSRMATLYREDIGPQSLERIKNLIASFPYLLRHHIRSGCLCNTDPESVDSRYRVLLQDGVSRRIETRYEGDKASDDVNKLRACYVDRRDIPWSLLDDSKRDTLLKVARSTSRPLWVCDRLGLEIKNLKMESRVRLTLLKNVDELANTVGACERICQTAVPLNYARHALRGLSLWLFTLPFCLVKDLGLMTGPATGIIAWVLFGIYQIGYEIEDPFEKSLRLSILCDAVRKDVIGDKESDSAYYIEEEEEDIQQIDEPRTLYGLDGKVGDLFAETDPSIFGEPSLKPLSVNAIGS